jgi:hypothetical protein
MSVLQRNIKPQVDFDPANKQHRKAYCNFVQSGKWGEDAPKFFVDFPHTNLKDMLSAKVSAYYLNKEFK